MGPINAPAMAELCVLIERPMHQLLPDAIWLSGQAKIYRHLRNKEALSLTDIVASSVMCPDCMSISVKPEKSPQGDENPYRAYCYECGWTDLPKERARVWQASPTRVADWLNVALGLKTCHPVKEVLSGVLWHLGEREQKRKRRSFFFGCQLTYHPASVGIELERLAAPGTEVVITTSDLHALRSSNLSSRLFIPLSAIAHLRKGRLVIENLDAYFDGLATVITTDETSLRLLHSQRVVLINGTKIPVSPQVHDFLTILEEAEGDEVHKRYIASKLKITTATFRTAGIFKRHKQVQEVFIGNDNNGNYWLKPEFLILERG